VNGDLNFFREASMKHGYGIRCAGAQLCALGMIFCAGLALASSHYTDLRDVEPIHGDAAAGATRAKVCFACHGENGTSVAPIFPRLAGQRVDYLYHRLLTFKRASAKDPYYSKSPMTPMAVPLSDSDMRNLADKGPYLVYPVLRGQYLPYLISRLTNFRMDLPHDTTSDFIMSNVTRTLDDDSLQAIAAWLSSLPPAKSL